VTVALAPGWQMVTEGLVGLRVQAAPGVDTVTVPEVEDDKPALSVTVAVTVYWPGVL
jgi:hypothetical protein